MCNLNEIEYPRLRDFLKFYKLLKKSNNTIEKYQTNLLQFHDFLKEYKHINEFTDEVYNNITKEDLYAFLYMLDDKNESGATQNNKITSIKMFFGYLFDEVDAIDKNISTKLKTVKLDKKLPVYLTTSEIKRLLDAVTSDIKNPLVDRNVCIIIFFLMAGHRVSEQCDIKVSDINRNILNVFGKGNKERQIPLNELASRYYRQYLKTRSKQKVVDEEYLFLSNNGKKLNRSDMDDIVKKYAKRAKINKTVSCHVLRHSSATMYLREGVDIRTLQVFLGHSSVATTQIYTHVEDESLRKAVKKNPFANYGKEVEENSTEE